MQQKQLNALLIEILHGSNKAFMKFCDNHKSLNDQQIDDLINNVKTAWIQEKNPHALALCGYMHAYGIGGDINYQEAIKCYDKAIEMGSASAMCGRATLYKNGWGCDVNYEAAIKLYNDAIKLRHAAAMFNRAVMHGNGLGGNINYLEAIRLYDDAIDLENIPSIYNRALLHQKGLGGNINYAAAIELYKKAAKQGCIQAIHNLAFMHENGLGLPANKEIAIDLYYQAAQKGSDLSEQQLQTLAQQNRITARFKIFLLYFLGKGVTRNLYLARYYFDGGYIFKSELFKMIMLLRDDIFQCLCKSSELKNLEKITEVKALIQFIKQAGSNIDNPEIKLVLQHICLKEKWISLLLNDNIRDLEYHSLHLFDQNQPIRTMDKAYLLYQAMPINYPLDAEDYFHLASYLLMQLEFTPPATQPTVQRKIWILLYRGYLRGDIKYCYSLLIQLLHAHDKASNEKKLWDVKASNPEDLANKALIEKYVLALKEPLKESNHLTAPLELLALNEPELQLSLEDGREPVLISQESENSEIMEGWQLNSENTFFTWFSKCWATLKNIFIEDDTLFPQDLNDPVQDAFPQVEMLANKEREEASNIYKVVLQAGPLGDIATTESKLTTYSRQTRSNSRAALTSSKR